MALNASMMPNQLWLLAWCKIRDVWWSDFLFAFLFEGEYELLLRLSTWFHFSTMVLSSFKRLLTAHVFHEFWLARLLFCSCTELLLISVSHLGSLHLDQTLAWTFLNLIVHHLRRNVLHLRMQLTSRSNSIMTIIIFPRVTSDVCAFLRARAHLLVLRKLADHSCTLRLVLLHLVLLMLLNLHACSWTLMRVLSFGHNILLCSGLIIQLLRLVMYRELLARMELFKRSLILESTNLVRVLDTSGCEASCMLVFVADVWC